ncbi:sulfatase-like hydrolase/transferase [Marinicella sp. S1101]|uniref:sulfatase-like hydrolase/transferase n=1 Tax=Marinicella marina TaxID=2996016 RepID=UPI00226097A5|nr:sulfatase-like hydrolase/transferase [Marinicella marina]MCX7552942.1 sulfatase-like hydrolase/transferase [Marinicella marina]MDJ1139748.1 sulfatase-like hydrolase/transferase [Marinicella marina]
MSDFMIHLPKQIWSMSKVHEISLLLVVFFVLLSFQLIYLLFSKLSLAQRIDVLLLPKYKFKTLVYFSIFGMLFVWTVAFSYQRTNPKNWINEPFFSAFSENTSEFVSVKNNAEVLKDGLQRAEILKDINKQIPSKNIILIIVDALRSDRLSVNGYERKTTPNLEVLASKKDFQRVANFTSSCSDSVCGIYSILSSRRYNEFAYGLLDLTEMLKLIGYQTKFILSSNHRFKSLKKLYGNSIDDYYDGTYFPNSITLNNDDGVINKLKELEDFSGQANFIYIHLMSTHLLGTVKNEFQVFSPHSKHTPALMSDLNKKAMALYVEKISNGYDNGVIQADYYIGKSLNILRKKGYLDDSVVVITSDHGESMGEHGHFTHTFTLYNEEISIPFFFLSNDCQLLNSSYGTQIDVAPTILDCLEQPIPSTWKGRSLLKPYQPNRLTFHQTVRNNKVIMVIEESSEHMYKLMADLHHEKLNNFRLYDAYSDPFESKNLIDDVDSTKVNYLKNKLLEHFDLVD